MARADRMCLKYASIKQSEKSEVLNVYSSCPKVHDCSVLCDESLAAAVSGPTQGQGPGSGGVGSSSGGGGVGIINKHQHVRGDQLILPEVTGDNPRTPQRSLRTTNHCMTSVGKRVKSLTLLHDDHNHCLECFLI